jgi:hypothetical protein
MLSSRQGSAIPKWNVRKWTQSDYGTANGERPAAIVDEAGERRPRRIGDLLVRPGGLVHFINIGSAKAQAGILIVPRVPAAYCGASSLLQGSRS